MVVRLDTAGMKQPQSTVLSQRYKDSFVTRRRYIHTNAGICKHHGSITVETSNTTVTSFTISIIVTHTYTSINGIVYALISMPEALTTYIYKYHANYQILITYFGKHWHYQ